MKRAILTTRFHNRRSKRAFTSSIPVRTINKNLSTSDELGAVGNSGNSTVDFDLESSQHSLSQHEQRSISALNNWASIRDDCFSAYVDEMFFSPNSKCIQCEVNMASIRCQKCGPQVFLCQSCCEVLHSTVNHYHTPEIWKVSIPKYNILYLSMSYCVTCTVNQSHPILPFSYINAFTFENNLTMFLSIIYITLLSI